MKIQMLVNNTIGSKKVIAIKSIIIPPKNIPKVKIYLFDFGNI